MGSDTFWVCKMLSSTPFGFAKGCLVYLLGLRNVVWYTFGYAVWCIVSIFLELLMRMFHEVSARLSCSSKYCSAVAEKAIKPLVFKYKEAMIILFGSKNVLNIVYF